MHPIGAMAPCTRHTLGNVRFPFLQPPREDNLTSIRIVLPMETCGGPPVRCRQPRIG